MMLNQKVMLLISIIPKCFIILQLNTKKTYISNRKFLYEIEILLYLINKEFNEKKMDYYDGADCHH